MSQKVKVDPGLDGVVANSTSIARVDPEQGHLTYRGYPIDQLANHSCFEEVAYLILYGNLPSKNQLADFQQKENSHRAISDRLGNVIKSFPSTTHPMDALRTGVSFLGVEDPESFGINRRDDLERSIRLMAKIPTIIAADSRHRNGMEIIHPAKDLSFAENFFYMCSEKVPDKEIVRAFEVSLILYAEHGFAASTYTARVVSSSLSDIYSAVTAAIGSLKGPLHGGANEDVMRMLTEIGSPSKAESWVLDALREERKIPGFGHRLYKKGDPRVPIMRKYYQTLAGSKGNDELSDTLQILEKVMLREKGIHPNLDFMTGPAYYLMDFDMQLYTPMIVMARITGWAAHIIEQIGNNHLIRPMGEYQGSKTRNYVPIQQRD